MERSRHLDIRIEAFGFWQCPASYGPGGAPPAGWRPETLTADALDGAFGVAKPAGLHGHAADADPVKILVAARSGAEMSVVGSRGHGEFLGLPLSSVSTSRVESAGCLLVVTRDAPPGSQR